MKKKYIIIYSNYHEYENEIFCNRIKAFYDNGYILYKSLGIRHKILVFKRVESAQKQCIIIQNNISESINNLTTHLINEKQKILYQDRKMIIFEIDKDNSYSIDKIEKEQNVLLGLSYKKFIIPILLLLFDVFLIVYRICFFNYKHLIDYCDIIIFSILFLTSLFYLFGDLFDLKNNLCEYKSNKLFFRKRSTFKDYIFMLGDIMFILLLLSCLSISIISFFTTDSITILEIIRRWMIFLLGYVFSFKFRTPFCSTLTILFFYITLMLE